MGLQVSCDKLQMFEGLLDETLESGLACGRDGEILESFTCLGNIVCIIRGSWQKVSRKINLAYSVTDQLNTSIWHCQYR